LLQVIRGLFNGPQSHLMGSEGSVPPFDGISLVDTHGGPGEAWGVLELLGLVLAIFQIA
jgi:hypothetical protein